MAITGAHVVLHTTDETALREVLRDVFGFDHVDVHDGWLIFRLPPSELAVHPTDEPHHELTFMCDDLAATMDELTAKGIEFVGEPQDQRWGTSIMMALPGGTTLMLYQPRHASPA
jgi:hypothetical protein